MQNFPNANNHCAERGAFTPNVSIITVVYNAADDLQKTILSVTEQSYPHIEYIIIDGNSSDNTINIIEKYRSSIHCLISEPDNGIYDAMNKGLAAATGDYVQFLNAGDLFFNQNSLADIISSAGKDFDLLYGGIMLCKIGGRQLHLPGRDFTIENLRQYGTGVLCHQAMLVCRDLAPRYSKKYIYKGELNWYFDICNVKNTIEYFHCCQPFVYYFLGGFGYTNFIRNRLEWYRLLISRFGLRSVFNKQFLKVIYNDFKNRYSSSK